MNLYTWESMDKEVMSERIWRKVITGEKAMVAQVFIAKGGVVPEHHHEAEQISCIMDGRVAIPNRRARIVVCKGQVLLIPSNVPHSRGGAGGHARSGHLQPDPHDWLIPAGRLSPQ